MIKVYSTDTCPWCTKVKGYLKSKNASFVELNVGEDMEARAEMVTLSGQMGVPVVNIDGKIIIGFDKAEIDASLNN